MCDFKKSRTSRSPEIAEKTVTEYLIACIYYLIFICSGFSGIVCICSMPLESRRDTGEPCKSAVRIGRWQIMHHHANCLFLCSWSIGFSDNCCLLPWQCSHAFLLCWSWLPCILWQCLLHFLLALWRGVAVDEPWSETSWLVKGVFHSHLLKQMKTSQVVFVRTCNGYSRKGDPNNDSSEMATFSGESVMMVLGEIYYNIWLKVDIEQLCSWGCGHTHTHAVCLGLLNSWATSNMWALHFRLKQK